MPWYWVIPVNCDNPMNFNIEPFLNYTMIGTLLHEGGQISRIILVMCAPLKCHFWVTYVWHLNITKYPWIHGSLNIKWLILVSVPVRQILLVYDPLQTVTQVCSFCTSSAGTLFATWLMTSGYRWFTSLTRFITSDCVSGWYINNGY